MAGNRMLSYDLDSAINTQKKNLANIQPSWPHTWSISHITNPFCTLFSVQVQVCRSFFAILITANTWGSCCRSWTQSSRAQTVVDLCGVGMPRQTARLHLHSTTTVMERDQLWQLLNTAATYLVHIPTYLGTVSIIRTSGLHNLSLQGAVPLLIYCLSISMTGSLLLIKLIKVRFWGAWMAKSLERSPSTDVAQVRFQLSAICRLSLLLILA